MATSFFPVPGKEVLGLNATNVVAGGFHACAIPSGNPRSVVCWGGGRYETAAVSLSVPPGLIVSGLGAGVRTFSTCAIISDGSLQCWIEGPTLTATPVGATW